MNHRRTPERTEPASQRFDFSREEVIAALLTYLHEKGHDPPRQDDDVCMLQYTEHDNYNEAYMRLIVEEPVATPPAERKD